MRKLLIGTLLFLLQANIAHAGLFSDLVPDSMKAKTMANIKIPLDAIKKKDARVKKIEILAVRVAMKHKWNVQVACPGNRYCKNIKKAIDKEAWRIARSKVKSDYAAKAKMPKIKMVQARGYAIHLITKGI